MSAQVTFDNQIFTSQVHGGISRLFAELLKNRGAFGEDIGIGIELHVSMNQYLTSDTGYSGQLLGLPSNRHAARVLRRALREYGSLPPRGFRSSDLLHHTYYRPEVLRRTKGVRRVSTLYDMIPEIRPEHFKGGNPHLAKRLYMDQSDLIISISQASADQMLEVWPNLRSREITVVPLGVGAEFLFDGPSYAARSPYVLFVGVRGGYKNFDLLLEALHAAGPRLGHLDLLAAGGGPFSNHERALIGQLDLAGRVRQIPASDEELAALYRGATAFVFPSLHEGFGLPTLEAMACRCPVGLSDTPVFREVAGDAAVFFDPNSAESLAESLDRLTDPGTAGAMRSRGRARAEARTWAETARATADAYRRIL